MQNTVLQIFYTDKFGRRHKEPQGKFYYDETLNKDIYLADMNPNKWWRNYGGWSISKQILEAFSKVKVRPQIVYREKLKGMIYITNMTTFKKKGILVAYGSHQQYVLPIHNWTAKQVSLRNEPKDLPVITLSNWINGKSDLGKVRGSDFQIVDGRAVYITEPQQQSMI